VESHIQSQFKMQHPAATKPKSDWLHDGPLRVRDILARPLFAGAQVIAGRTGLHRVVRWVHILEVCDVKAFINGGELVLTTATGVGQNEERFISYVRQLIDGRASGLCIELGTAVQEIPPAVCDLADAHGFPLIVFPFQVRFVDITQDIHKLIVMQERQMLSEQEWLERLIRGETDHPGPRHTAGMRIRAGRHYRVAVIYLPHTDNLENHSDLPFLLRQSFQRHHLRVYLSVRIDSVVALLELEGNTKQWKPQIEAAMNHFRLLLRSHGLPDAVRVGLGNEINGPTEACDSYREALAAAAFAKACGEWMLFYEDAGVYR
jgi:hypothetical protein